MIHADFIRRDEQIVAFEMDGHANFAEQGADLVCAGATSIAFGMVNAISEKMGIEPVMEEDDGYLYYSVPEDLEGNEVVQILLEGMEHQLISLAYSYPDYITINSKK
ncbi:ribosomal-processing cysteine protease Prp [Listeria booriae]|uniref:Ribosomal processing cysteine protease Prp n=1 Tax=Listeria booriae TaxID=1552123 RepID=A0A7X0WEP1_9LIST|nr:ribosomal-processing cysteine protease Prp [Listeria booriae]MBC1211605.1 ribosomal-processing cysteine protease Prp [Listeria booriae]MBC1226651.1 ribosomal-processing cysteine protease Prp [Listeria booriae]MBC1230087.1 ribosomal-processing cysteine protease Prp [Listeria booriae]MBC1234580.1 ribosomal-processing cysteine protease Prp [Listeria booriae]MBC1245142.1 ribosomal-processing cysteine protease Prp [Listeria booriae]